MGDETTRRWLVSDRGAVFAHFLDPRLRLDEGHKLQELVAEAAAEHELYSAKLSSQVFWVAGQCDLLLRLEVPDLRFVSHLQKHLLSFPALSSTWIFSVPLERDAKPGDLAKGFDGGGIEFLLYLRFRRPLYRLRGVEPAIIDKLYYLIDEAEGIEGEIHLGMGWPDLLIAGRFDCAMELFFAFLLNVQGIHLPSKSGTEPVFQRTLTLLAFPADRKAISRRPFQSVLLAQTIPGCYRRAHEALGQRLDDFSVSHAPLLSLDGQYDLIVPLGVPSIEASPEFLSQFFDLAADREARRNLGIERLETHLMAVEVNRLPDPATDQELLLTSVGVLDQPGCRCSDHSFKDLRDRLDSLAPSVVSEELKITVASVLTLFGYALNDSTNCCDALPALQACSCGLERLLDRIRDLHQLFEGRADRRYHWFEALQGMREYLDTWCVLAEKVLSERTAGSFLQFFQQADQVAAHRGGMQKLLHLADHLSAELYESTHQHDEEAARRLLFATIYEPIDTIQSERVLGILKVPLRYRFTLPLVLPQLWHEVGQHIFNERYPAQLCPKTNQRLLTLGWVLEEDESLFEKQVAEAQLSKVQIKDLRLQRKTYRTRLESRLPLDSSGLLSELGDLYADLVVVTFGFREDWQAFVYYLSTLFFESKEKRNAPPEVWERHCMALGMRLFFVARFLDRRMGVSDTPFFWEPGGRKACAEEVVSALTEVVRKDHYSGIRLPTKFAERLYINIATSAVYNLFFEQYLSDFLTGYGSLALPDQWDRVRETAARFERGELVEFATEDRINDHYFYLYCSAVSDLVEDRRPSAFRQMAALGKSASSAFFRRQSRVYS